MPILVTGGTGFIGRSLLSALTPNHEVIALRRSGGNEGSGIKWLSQDLTKELTPEMPRNVDTVIHLAQSPYYRAFPENVKDVFDVNVWSTVRLLDWSRSCGVKRFILVSSGGIYGSGNRGFKEDEIPNANTPLGFYVTSKRCAEMVAEAYVGHFTIIVLRMFFVYGRGQRPTMLIPRLVRTILEGQPVILQGKDGIRLNPIHISDAVRALLSSLSVERSQKINVAGPEVLTLREIGTTISVNLNRAARFQLEETSILADLIGDIGRMSEVLGAPKVKFIDGVKEVCKEAIADSCRK